MSIRTKNNPELHVIISGKDVQKFKYMLLFMVDSTDEDDFMQWCKNAVEIKNPDHLSDDVSDIVASILRGLR